MGSLMGLGLRVSVFLCPVVVNREIPCQRHPDGAVPYRKAFGFTRDDKKPFFTTRRIRCIALKDFVLRRFLKLAP
jgi:hypothetical protein